MDAGMEEGEEEHSLLTASPLGTQESGAHGLREGARAGGSGGGKVTSGTADRGGRGAAMGRTKNTVGKREAAGVGSVQTPGEWGKTLGAARPPEWTLIPTEWNGRRGAVRPPKWRKTPREDAREWRGGSSRPQKIRPVIVHD